MDYTILEEGLEDFAINGGSDTLVITFIAERDGVKYTETIGVKGESIRSFKVIPSCKTIMEWTRRV